MADVFTPAKRSLVMSAIRSNGNRDTELKLMAIFRVAKLRGWRRRYPLAGKPNICFPKEKVVVFVDGCFWHACPRHGRIPSSNVHIGGRNWRAQKREMRRLHAISAKWLGRDQDMGAQLGETGPNFALS